MIRGGKTCTVYTMHNMRSVVPSSLDYPVESLPSMIYATNVAWQDHSFFFSFIQIFTQI